MQYQAEAYQMDSDERLANLGHWPAQQLARLACEKYEAQPLEFRTRQLGLWKAQGATCWFQIRRVEEEPAGRVVEEP